MTHRHQCPCGAWFDCGGEQCASAREGLCLVCQHIYAEQPMREDEIHAIEKRAGYPIHNAAEAIQYLKMERQQNMRRLDYGDRVKHPDAEKTNA